MSPRCVDGYSARYLASFFPAIWHHLLLTNTRVCLIGDRHSRNLSFPNLPSQTWPYMQLWQELGWFLFSLGSDKPQLSEAKKNAG